jgi:type 1 fimbria pilin
MIRKILLSTLIILSPIAAMAGMTSGEIHISLTILPTCEVSVANAQPSVSCAQRSFSQPRISESQLGAIPGISLGSKLVTIEW